MSYISELGLRARASKASIALMSTDLKDQMIRKISEDLLAGEDEIMKANAADLEDARKNGMSSVMTDRLLLNEKRIRSMSEACLKLTELPDPVGRILDGSVRPNGLKIRRVAVPFGVVGVIYESRPNVTVDAATLCLKSGNAVMLRGGKEAIRTNLCLADLMRRSVKSFGLPEDLVTFVEDTDRASALEMMRLTSCLDLLIPRGGAGLIRSVVENATVPVIETGTGNCHIYIDETADLPMACEIVFNAKTSRPSVCNAAESLLVHESIAAEFLPMVKEVLDRKDVTIYGCEKTVSILGGSVLPATEEDYGKEYLDFKISVKVVKDIGEAIEHIAKYSTGHSEAIVTRDYNSAGRFTREVDSAAVYVNASTRFTDGGEFGYGAEIGISTQKLHVRGPLGLEALTTSKFIIEGDGQIRV